MNLDAMKDYLIKEYNEAAVRSDDSFTIQDEEFWNGYIIAIRNVAAFMKIKIPGDNSLDFKKIQVDE